ncbi:MAG: hypothetical protein N2423_00725 [Novosphingobium sp.]|nr:hypothetical protein [Novosphingobium sp.]
MSQDRERGSLEGPPPDMLPKMGAQPSSTPPGAPQPAQGQAQPAAGFDLNQPTIIALLYLVSPLVGLTALIGVILAFIWRDQPKADWEISHYQYLINTFWIALVGFTLGFILLFVLIGLLVLPVVLVWVIVRSVMSLINAQKHQPMPNPGTLLV